MHDLPPVQPGTVIDGQFRLEAKLGEGGMGALYLAHQVELDRAVAVKFVHPYLLASNPDALARFRQEARSIAQINHPHVVQLFTVGQTADGHPYFVMEYVPGHTLASEVRRGPLVAERALKIAQQMVEALGAAHARGIVHRDLKPDNVMLAHVGADPDFVKLVDFGIAKLVSRSGGQALTGAGYVLGTPAYMAPEQFTGSDVDHRADLYSFGVVLYEMLTGRLLFEGDTPFEFARKHSSAPAIPPSQYAPVSSELDAVVMQCLQKDPSLRPQSASELAERLHGLVRRRQVVLEQAPVSGSTVVLTSANHSAVPAGSHQATSMSATGEESLAAGGEVGAPAVGVPPHERATTGVSTAAPRRRTSSSGRLSQVAFNLLYLASVGVFAYGLLGHEKAVDLYRSARSFVGAMSWSDGEADTRRAIRCLNRHARRGRESFFRYASWVDPERGPEARGRVLGVRVPYAPEECMSAAGKISDPELSTAAVSFGEALDTLHSITSELAPYYEFERWRDDGFSSGRERHPELVAAFREFFERERELRANVERRVEARDAALISSLQAEPETVEYAFHAGRVAMRDLVRAGNKLQLSEADLESVSGALQRARSAFAHLDDSAGSRRVRAAADDVLEVGYALCRRPRGVRSSAARKRAGGVAGPGTPSAMLSHTPLLVLAVNQHDEMRRAGLVELEPVLAQEPARGWW